MAKLGKAIAIAAEVFADQEDWSGNPAFLHSFRVMEKASMGATKSDYYWDHINDFASESIAIVAVLHDVLEDCGRGLSGEYADEIEYLFGKNILDAVIALTHDKEKETYFEYIDRCKQNVLARCVKIIDNEINIGRCQMDRNKYASLLKKYRKAQKILNEKD